MDTVPDLCLCHWRCDRYLLWMIATPLQVRKYMHEGIVADLVSNSVFLRRAHSKLPRIGDSIKMHQLVPVAFFLVFQQDCPLAPVSGWIPMTCHNASNMVVYDWFSFVFSFKLASIIFYPNPGLSQSCSFLCFFRWLGFVPLSWMFKAKIVKTSCAKHVMSGLKQDTWTSLRGKI